MLWESTLLLFPSAFLPFFLDLMPLLVFFSNYIHLNDCSLRIENEQHHIVIATPQRRVCWGGEHLISSISGRRRLQSSTLLPYTC